jgi:ATP-dependent exoDNAse (exonuclease V) beta subunit
MLYPQEEMRQQSAPAPGCPAFGGDSVLERGPKGDPPAGGSVRPGLHRLRVDGPEVVWWDPAVLPPEREEPAPLRHQRLLEPDAHGAAAEGEAQYIAWKREREAVLARASQPTLTAATVTSLARAEGGLPSETVARVPVRVETVTRSQSGRPGGRRFGALVHALLASIDFDEADSLQRAAAMNGRLVGATDDEVDAAITAVRSALAHPLLRKAAGRAGDLRRESPVLLRLDDGSLAEGVVDLAFPDDEPGSGGWTVVDFKTDREFALAAERHVAQVRLYAAAIGRLMHAPVQGVVLVV